MGNDNQTIKTFNPFKRSYVQQMIQKLGSQIDFRIFSQFLFTQFDQYPHPTIGRIVVSNTFILQQFFLLLTNRNKQAKLQVSLLKETVVKFYKNPEKAIEYSFRLIDLDDDKKITKGQFLNFIDNCFINLQLAAEKQIQDEQFTINFKNWVKQNKKIFLQNVLNVFEQYARSNPQFWFLGDFTRWIKDKSFWSLDIQIGHSKLRTPINLLCLFGIQI